MDNIFKYRDRDNNWQQFDRGTITDIHGDMYYYRDLYDGKHHTIFPRAINLINRGEIIDVYASDKENTPKNVRTPYVMFNACKIVVDVPSMLVARSIGQFKTNHNPDSIAQEEMHDSEVTGAQEEAETNEEENASQEAQQRNTSTLRTNDNTLYESTDTDDYNGEALDPQQAMIDTIVKNSNIRHKMNVVQLQVDGGIVAVPSFRNQQISIEFKERNVYYPHDDDLGADLVYELTPTLEEEAAGISFVHVYTERQEGTSVKTYDRLYRRNEDNQMELVDDPAVIEDKLRLGQHFVDGVLEKTFTGRQRLFITYLANDPTFTNKLGHSTLEGLDGKQEEVNWTLTRTAQTFERNGKPRISIPKGTMDQLKKLAAEQYGDENKIDHEMLEVTEIDDITGKSMEIHQIDTTKIGDMSYVKDIVRSMLAETQTSENAVEFVKANSASPQSGTAKFYDLIVSIIKAEHIRDDYVEFLKDAVEASLWFANKQDSSIIIERPNIMLKDMLPQPKQELSVDNIAKYNSHVQSLEETVRANNPDKSEEWVQEELQRIEDEKSSTDSMTADLGAMTLQNFNNNRDAQGNPLDEFGNPVDTKAQIEVKDTEEDGPL